MKVVAKPRFSIVNKIRDQRCGCTKADALHLKKDWGYTIKNNRKKTVEDLSEEGKAPLEHMSNNHDNCSAECCFKTKASEEGKTYNDKDIEFGRKKKRQLAVKSPGKEYSPVSNRQFLKELLHMFDTQKKNQ